MSAFLKVDGSEIYAPIGNVHPCKIRKLAPQHYQKKFAVECLDTLKEFIESINGFNAITRPFYRKVMKLDV